MKEILRQLFETAIQDSWGEAAFENGRSIDPSIQAAARPEYGDFQANFAMRLAKILKKKPMEIAQAVVDKLQTQPTIFKTLTPSGPGFINIVLTNEFLSQRLQFITNDDRLGISPVKNPQNVVIDYANANVAKEMHVGHIRSIVIGDAIIRILDFLGHHTIKQCHLGDWGTQFGMLIEHMFETGNQLSDKSVTDLDVLYKASKKRFDEDADFAEKARTRVVSLQQGDEETRKVWQQLVKHSLAYFQKIYNKLDVALSEEDSRGESFYNPMLADVVKQLEQKGLAITSDGAKVVFLDEFSIPYLIQKKDGGYLYATTDIAAVKFRIEELKANRIIYLTDARQRQHFAMLFATVKKAGWEEGVSLEHIPFGAILGPDNKPFKTRSGESIRLLTLLEEAENRALQIAREKNPTQTEEQLKLIAHTIGIGALKYADLRADKIKDYVFDWDKLLAFEGNTAPYLQNAYVRIRAVFRKGNIVIDEIKQAPIILVEPAERHLAIKILEFPEVVYSVADDLALHRLCDYLHDLAAMYHRFYENCPILTINDGNTRNSRLLLSDVTARTLQLGLSLLGINTLESM